MANGRINGRELEMIQTISYYIIAATAGHDTTSSSTAGAFWALAERPEELAKLRAHKRQELLAATEADLGALAASVTTLRSARRATVRARWARAAGRVPLCRADALRPVSSDAVVLLDPSRRAGGRRRFDPRTYLPPLDQLIDTYRERATVIKCAPGIDFDAVRRLGFPGENRVPAPEQPMNEPLADEILQGHAAVQVHDPKQLMYCPVHALLRLPDLVRRIEEKFPPKGGAPEAPPLPEVELVWERKGEGRSWLGYVAAALGGAGLVWLGMAMGMIAL